MVKESVYRCRLLSVAIIGAMSVFQVGCVAESEPTEADLALEALIVDQNLIGDPSEGRELPLIGDALPQLGMKLFYSKSLGGNFDTGCVSCHHPSLGGADGLTLPVGVDATDPELLGLGRENTAGVPVVPRNSPTVFNAGLWDSGMFLDSRVESLGKEPKANGSISPIRTPDTDIGVADLDAGANLPAAQAGFPVTSTDEMKTDLFEDGSTNDEIRDHLAARIGGYGEGEGELGTNTWLEEFQTAYVSAEDAETLITFENIAHAIGEFERSMVFVDTPWHQYVNGDRTVLTEDQKEGALLFFTPVNAGGAGCSGCHSGDLMSDERHHTIAFPQIGPGKGDGNNDDFGRERETANPADRYRFRTASLLNIALTGPYGHAGSYETLEQVVRHYVNPNQAVTDFFAQGAWCQLPQYEGVTDCETLYPDAQANTQLALQKVQQERQARMTPFISPMLNNTQIAQLVSFLEALTDECALDRACLADWIPEGEGPDGNQLNAVDAEGDAL
ncbi:cytochrome C peroxidase [Gammaproteobacteria bacterium 45_16_T64]|nr:cytochrome C peroxidase [Gammaproteobacteria bacterium 45_16_T64]